MLYNYIVRCITCNALKAQSDYQSHLQVDLQVSSNIEREFGLKSVEKHSDDATSVLLWIEEMKTMGIDNPVLLYKQQGEQPSMGCNYLEVDDFVLIIQTQLQKQMMKEYGKKSNLH